MSSYIQQHVETISQERRDLISLRYHTITRAVNKEFWYTDNTTANSLYVGSYGRGTAIDTSDIDVLMQLPRSEYERFDAQHGNGQSRLLQAVKRSILASYPRTNVHADGQVVVMEFDDGMKFEVLPAFKKIDYWGNPIEGFTYPDTNMGGNWKSTNPKAEQKAMRERNLNSNGLLFDTCKQLRRIRDEHFSSYHLSGIVIDSFVYSAIADWHWCKDGEVSTHPAGTYENRLLNHLYQIHPIDGLPFKLSAPGSNQDVDGNSSLNGLKKVLEYLA